MKKITVLSLVTAAVLLTACSEDTKKTAAEATEKVTKTVKETTEKAVEATKAAAAAAKEEAAKAAEATAKKAAELKAAAEEKATAAAEVIKEKTAETTQVIKEKVADAADAVKEAVAPKNEAGKAAYAKCKGCHGADGKTKALAKSEVIAGQPVADLVTKINEYKAGTRNVSGMGTLMKGQVASMSDEDIKAVSEYISAM